jgi:hypothetical protein
MESEANLRSSEAKNKKKKKKSLRRLSSAICHPLATGQEATIPTVKVVSLHHSTLGIEGAPGYGGVGRGGKHELKKI